MPDLAYVNGTFLPLADARVSIEDRGFQFGDGVYEVVRTYGGSPFHLHAHLDRLLASADAIRLAVPETPIRLSELIAEGIRQAGFPETKVYLQVTRGVAPRDHAFPKTGTSTLVLTFRSLPPAPGLHSQGVEVLTMDDIRWARCDIKSLNLLGNVLARQRAVEAGVFEALFVRQGLITEGSVSNVMAIVGGQLWTAPTGPMILAGVTRQFVLDLARGEGIAVREEALPLERFRGADEVFLTGTTVEILPVVKVDGGLIGGGIPGPVTRRLADRFRAATRR